MTFVGESRKSHHVLSHGNRPVENVILLGARSLSIAAGPAGPELPSHAHNDFFAAFELRAAGPAGECRAVAEKVGKRKRRESGGLISRFHSNALELQRCDLVKPPLKEIVMPVKVQVIFYSLYGHVFHMAQAVVEGARQVAGAEVELFQVAETLPTTVLEKMGAVEAKKAFAHVPIADSKRLVEADAIFFGSGTRYGSATAQMQAFFDSTGPLWSTGRSHRQSGRGVHLHCQPARRSGNHAHQHADISDAPGDDCGGSSLFRTRIAQPPGDNRRDALRRINHHRPQGRANAEQNELAIAPFQGRHANQIAARLAAK